MDYKEFRQRCITGRDSKVFIPCGSVFELPLKYFISNPTDSDRLYYVNDICAIPSNRNPPKNFKGTVLIIESEGNHPGFVRLKRRNFNNSYFLRPDVLCKSDNEGPARVIHHEYGLSPYVRWAFKHFSPSWNQLPAIKTDISYSAYCPYWPPEAKEWLTRKRAHGWPDEKLIERVKKGGCHFVSKPHQNNLDDNTQWRFSFSKAELILINNWTSVQKHSYHVLRLAKNKACEGKSDPILRTYHFKTFMLWACEQKPSEFWNDTRACVPELVEEMIETLKDRQCRNYFIPENNMLDFLGDEKFEEFNSELSILANCVNDEQLYAEPKIISFLRQSNLFFSLPNSVSEFVLLNLRCSLFPLHEEIHGPLRRSMYKCECFLPELKQLYDAIMLTKRLMTTPNVLDRAKNEDCKIALQGYTNAFNATTDETRGRIATPISRELDRPVAYMIRKCILRPLLLHREHDEKNLKNGCELHQFDDDFASLEDPSLAQEPSDEENTRCFPVHKKIGEKILNLFLNKLTTVIGCALPSPMYLMSASYLANFYCVFMENYDKALHICEEVYKMSPKIEQLFGFYIYFKSNLPMIISTDFSSLFDKHIRTVLGFVMLYKALQPSSSSMTESKVVFPLSPIRFLRYIEYQCKLKTVKDTPKVFAYTPDDHENINNSDRMTVCFSEVFLAAALRCNGVTVLRFPSRVLTNLNFSFGAVLGRIRCHVENYAYFQRAGIVKMLGDLNSAVHSDQQLDLRKMDFAMAELETEDILLYFHFQSPDDAKQIQKRSKNGELKTQSEKVFNQLLPHTSIPISVSVGWFPGDYERCMKDFH